MSTTKMSKVATIKKKEVGIYTSKKPMKKDFKGKGKIYIEPRDNCMDEKLEEVTNEMKKHMKKDSVIEELAEGKEVLLDKVVEKVEEVDREKEKSLTLNNLIGQVNRKMLMLEMMEEKKLMEEQINRKMDWDDMKKKNQMLTSYLDMKKATVMVEEFMSSIMKEELVNSRFRDNETKMTSREVEKISEEVFNEMEKVEIQNSNPTSCKCSKCRINYLMYGLKKEKHNLDDMKVCMLSNNFKMEIASDSEKFSLYASKKKDMSRHITLLDKKNNKTVMDLKITDTERDLWQSDEYDFSVGVIVNLYNMGLEKNISVTYSSYLLTSWIRLMDLDLSLAMILPPNTEVSEEMEDYVPQSSCFMKMLRHMMQMDLEGITDNMMFYSMAELPEWMEMKFLSKVGKHNLYVKYTSKEDIKNHVSVRRFKGAIKVRAYILSTPMFRNIKWFMNEDSPEFNKWKEEEPDRKMRMVLSMLYEINEMAISDKMANRDQNIENTLWMIAINFENIHEMVNHIYSVDMAELRRFFKNQKERLKILKEKMMESLQNNLKDDFFYGLSDRRLPICNDLIYSMYNEWEKYRGMTLTSKSFKIFLRDPMWFEFFTYNSMLMFDSLDELLEIQDKFSYTSTVAMYIAKMDKLFQLMEDLDHNFTVSFDKEDYDHLNLWKRKIPVGISAELSRFSMMEMMIREQEEPSYDYNESPPNDEDDLGAEAYHNIS